MIPGRMDARISNEPDSLLVAMRGNRFRESEASIALG